MKLSEKLKNYIREIVREESEELNNRESLLEENVRNLNAQLDGYESLVENVRNLNAQLDGYESLVENVRNLNAQLDGYESLVENVRNLNAQLDGYESLVENVRNLNAQLDGYESLVENVRNLNAQLDGYESLVENVRNLNDILHGYENVIENLRNNNTEIEQLSSMIEMQKVKLVMLEKRYNTHSAPQINPQCNASKTVQDPLAENVYSGIDYFDFENHFRGSMHQIKENQQQYVKYYEGKTNVIDLGCGRGEFLELLKDNGITAKGVDLYDEFAQMCVMKGLDVTCDDALHFLGTQEKVGGIFASQLIEHLTINQIVELCRLAYEKLAEGACIVMETPNPTCLTIFSNAFYVDPSHNKPIHPLTVEYILRQSGFTDIEIVYTDTSRSTCFIPTISGIENAVQFNEAMHVVSELLFGSQDYAIIARKQGGELKAS